MDTMTSTTIDATTTNVFPAAPAAPARHRYDAAATRPLGFSPTATLVALAAGVGPALLAASSVAWIVDAEELRAILTFWALPALALAVVGVAARLERSAPRTRAFLTALVVLGACAGSAFGLEAAMVEHFGTERLIMQDTPSAMLILGLPGPLFPLSLLVTGIVSFRKRTLAPCSAVLLAVAGALFPMSRIPQIPALALVADLILLAALAPVAVNALRTQSRTAQA